MVFASRIAVIVFGSVPVMVVIVVVVVVVVAVFFNKIAVVVFGEGRPPNGLLSTYQPPNGENKGLRCECPMMTAIRTAVHAHG